MPFSFNQLRFSRIHEGLVWSNRDTRTLLDKLALLLLSLAGILDRKLLLVADAYYASGKMITQLLGQGHHLVTRAKSRGPQRQVFVAGVEVERCGLSACADACATTPRTATALR